MNKRILAVCAALLLIICGAMVLNFALGEAVGGGSPLSPLADALFHTKQEAVALWETKEAERAYEKMTLEDARELDEYELVECVFCRLDAEDEEELAAMSEPQRMMYTVLWYQAEVNNGGLCQYFVNSSSMTAPYLEEALNVIGADAHLELFHRFVTENGIDVNDLDSFRIESADEFEEQLARYPFEAFDDSYYELERYGCLDELCSAYIQAHIEDFFE